MRPVQLVVCGPPPPLVAARHGSVSSWFARALGPTVTVAPWDARAGAAAPDPAAAAGIIISGSEASVTAPEPWMDEVTELARRAVEVGTPVLGVCFGQQLLARAFGATVREHPRGRELGTFDVHLSPAGRADPLFRGLPEAIAVQLSHGDEVVAAPGIEVLAGNDHSAVQAVAFGDAVRGVQFHPEFDAAIARAHVEAAGELLPAQRQAILDTVADAPCARQVLANWVAGWVRRG